MKVADQKTCTEFFREVFSSFYMVHFYVGAALFCPQAAQCQRLRFFLIGTPAQTLELIISEPGQMPVACSIFSDEPERGRARGGTNRIEQQRAFPRVLGRNAVVSLLFGLGLIGSVKCLYSCNGD